MSNYTSYRSISPYVRPPTFTESMFHKTEPMAELAKHFEEWSTAKVSNVAGRSLTTTDRQGGALPPYIPFVGKKYWSLPEERRVMIYATAQNMGADHGNLAGYGVADKNQQVRRMHYSDSSWKKGPPNEAGKVNGYGDVSIGPYMTGYLPFIGAMLLRRLGCETATLDDAHEQLAVTNFFKFSMHNGRKDINPFGKGAFSSSELREEYIMESEKLVREELNTIKPYYVIAMGEVAKRLNNLNVIPKVRILRVNDPSWILQGHRGLLTPDKWGRGHAGSAPERQGLFDHEFERVAQNMKGKEEALNIYFRHWEKNVLEKALMK